MSQRVKRILCTVLMLLVCLGFTACRLPGQVPSGEPAGYSERTSALGESVQQEIQAEQKDPLSYTDEEVGNDPQSVRLYLKEHGGLPPFYITKNEAKERGWIASKGNLRKLGSDLCIGGDRFGNREGKLPKAKGRRYFECDVNYDGGRRGPERIVFSNDGLIFYTPDHYETFYDITDAYPGEKVRNP